MSFLFVDKILDFNPGKSITGLKLVTENDSYLSWDKENKPYFPAALIGETLGQLAAWNVMHTHAFRLRPVAGVVAKAELFRGAYLHDCLRLESVIETLDDRAVLYHSTAWVSDEIVARIEGALGPLLPMEDFIDTTVVKAQFDALFLPEKPHRHKVPMIAPNLMGFDKIIQQDQNSLIAEKWVAKDAPYLSDHFPNKPVLPMTILLESKIRLAEQFLSHCDFVKHHRISALRKIKMNVFVLPGEKLTTTIKIKEKKDQEMILTFLSEVNQKRVCVLEMVINYE